MAVHDPRPNLDPDTDHRPAVDEWGIYDPSQAGLEALFERVAEKRRAAADVDGPKVASSMRDANTFTGTAKKPDLI